MKQEELKAYYEIYTECWKLFKKYSNPVDTDDFWQSFAKECRELNQKFGQRKFARNMILATYEEIGNLQEVAPVQQKGANNE